jgi:uncharacterized protein
VNVKGKVSTTLRALIVTMATLALQPAIAAADDFSKGMAAYEAKKFSKSRTIFAGLANAGHLKAQYWLGTMYELGLGGAADPAAALTWYRKAAEQGNGDAQYALAEKLLTGQGVDSNPAEAVSWFRKAAAQGRLQAFLMLAITYRDGAGVPKDLVLAHVFASIHVREWGKLDLVERNKLAKELAAILTEEQRAESEALQSSGFGNLKNIPDSSTTGQK